MDNIKQIVSTKIFHAPSTCGVSGWSLQQQILLSKFRSVIKLGGLGSASLQGLLLKQEEFYYRRSPLGVNTIIFCFTAPNLTFRIQVSPESV